MRNAIKEESFGFAVRIVHAVRSMQREHREFVLSKQLLRSGTAIGALVREAQQAESRRDFLHKLSIALKEADETAYWLELAHETGYIKPAACAALDQHVRQLLRLLTSIIKSTRERTSSA